jgi:prephenate dehydrogenase/chorismate mutase
MIKKLCIDDLHVVIVGVKGSIGRFIAQKIASEVFEVIGIDIADSDTAIKSLEIAFRTDDIINPSELTRTDLATADIVLLAVSQKVMVEALPNILPCLNSNCLIVETLSTKSAFLGLLDRYDFVQQVLGINPMFSGDLNPSGRPVAAVVYRNGFLVSEFLALLKTWQLNVILMDPAEHDREMATLQSLSHAIILSFGKTLSKLHITESTIAMLAPPPFQVLLSLLARMTQNHPDVYWEIQSDNPHAREVRETLQTAMSELENMIMSGGRSEFHSEIGKIKSTLIAPNPSFLETSCKLFELINVLHNRKQSQSSKNHDTLSDFRSQIDDIDDDIVDLLGRRLEIVRQVAWTKKASNTSVMQMQRVDEVKLRCKVRGQRNNIRDKFIEKLYQLIIDEACYVEYDLVEDQQESVL